MLAPALRIARALRVFPDPIAPSLLGLWRRQMVLECGVLEDLLGVACVPATAGMEESAAWLRERWGLERKTPARRYRLAPALAGRP